MTEISAIAEWLRQRKGETDGAWIDRLRILFDLERGQDAALQGNVEKADRIGERLWKRYLARRNDAI